MKARRSEIERPEGKGEVGNGKRKITTDEAQRNLSQMQQSPKSGEKEAEGWPGTANEVRGKENSKKRQTRPEDNDRKRGTIYSVKGHSVSAVIGER